MLKVGDIVTIWDNDTNWEYEREIRSHMSIDDFIKDVNYYEIMLINGEFATVRNITINRDNTHTFDVKIDEYLFFTKEDFEAELKGTVDIKLAICNKIKQLYRKHNNSDTTFKFQGV